MGEILMDRDDRMKLSMWWNEKLMKKNEKCCVLYPWNVNFGGCGGYIKNIQCGCVKNVKNSTWCVMIIKKMKIKMINFK